MFWNKCSGFVYVISFNFVKNSFLNDLCLIGREVEAQRDGVTILKPHS